MIDATSGFVAAHGPLLQNQSRRRADGRRSQRLPLERCGNDCKRSFGKQHDDDDDEEEEEEDEGHVTLLMMLFHNGFRVPLCASH